MDSGHGGDSIPLPCFGGGGVRSYDIKIIRRLRPQDLQQKNKWPERDCPKMKLVARGAQIATCEAPGFSILPGENGLNYFNFFVGLWHRAMFTV